MVNNKGAAAEMVSIILQTAVHIVIAAMNVHAPFGKIEETGQLTGKTHIQKELTGISVFVHIVRMHH